MSLLKTVSSFLYFLSYQGCVVSLYLRKKVLSNINLPHLTTYCLVITESLKWCFEPVLWNELSERTDSRKW